jgi:hypothetical protein
MELSSPAITHLFLLALPVACIAWTVTHEELFREPREYCVKRSQDSKYWWQRKFFYMFTCEYCFSHYVTILFLFITKYTLLFSDWRGYLIAGFAIVWVANFYMTIFGLLRQGLKEKKIDATIKETELKEIKEDKEAR